MRDEEIPRHVKKVKKHAKRFGIESSAVFLQQTWVHTDWYRTEKARDQAIVDLVKHTCNILKENGRVTKYQKVER